MLRIQKNIETLKKETKERQEELKNEEICLTEAVTTYEDKIAELEKPVDFKDYAFPMPKRISTSASNLCQVIMIQKGCFRKNIFNKKFLCRKPKTICILWQNLAVTKTVGP